jgi:hypothetical protein
MVCCEQKREWKQKVVSNEINNSISARQPENPWSATTAKRCHREIPQEAITAQSKKSPCTYMHEKG